MKWSSYERYYANETVRHLIAEYEIDVKPHSLVKIFPSISFETCIMCGKPKWTKLHSRGISYSYGKPHFCKECNHMEDSADCKYENLECIKIREFEEEQERQRKEAIEKEHEEMLLEAIRIQKEKNEKKKQIVLEFCSSENKIRESNLTLQQKLFLGLFIKVSQLEETDELKIPIYHNGPITPTPDFFEQSVEYIISEKLIIPSENSPLDAFLIDDEDQVTFDRFEVIFTVNVEPLDSDHVNMVQRLIYPDSEEFLLDMEFCKEIWKRVALGETLSYFYYRLKKVGFDRTPKKRYFQVFGHLLNYFSITQLYNFISKTVAAASQKVLEGALSPQDAPDSIIKHVENYGARAIIENWNITAYQRLNFQSVLTKMVFNDILRISYMGYEERPTTDL